MADQNTPSTEGLETKAPKEEDPAIETDGSILASYISNGQYKLSMWIPSDLAGRVVGKKGVVISNIKTETKVELINALAPVGDSLWVAVVILGEWKSIIAAYKAVSDIVHGEVDDVVLEYTISRNKPFFIFGKNKMNVIKLVSAKSNVRIFLPELVNPKEQREYKHQTEPMTLEGSFDNVKRAVALLEQEAIQYREKFGDGFGKKPAQLLSGPPSRGPDEDSKHSTVRVETRKDDGKRDALQRAKEDRKHEEVSRRDQKPEKDRETKPARGTDEKERPNSSVPEKLSKPSITSNTPGEVSDGRVSTSSQRVGQKSEPVHKLINIPSSLVGLLLSKHTPLPKASVMNQIQTSTQTVISKFGTIPEKSIDHPVAKKDDIKVDDVSKNRRRRAASGDSGESSDSDSSSSGSSTTDSDDESTVTAPEIPDSSHAVLSEARLGGDHKRNGEQEFVIFRITGYAEENVNMAFDHLERIVKGDRIKEVMDCLKSASKNLVRRESTLKKDGRGERGGDRDKSNNKLKKPEQRVERKPEEKASEKEGAWKRGEKTEKYEPKEKRLTHSSNSSDNLNSKSSTAAVGDNSKKGDVPSERPDRHQQQDSNKSERPSDNKVSGSKPEKQLGKFEKRVSGPPAKPFSGDSSSRGGKGSSSSTDKKTSDKSHPSKDKAHGERKSSTAPPSKPNK